MEFKGKLLAGNEYVFRVKAENKYGVGAGRESDDIVARNPFTTPGRPGVPEIASVTQTTVTLFWSRPVNDGGAEISGYVLEKKIKNGPRWNR